MPAMRWSRWLKYSCPKKSAEGSCPHTTSGLGLLGEPQEAGALYAEFKCEDIVTETVKAKGTTLAALTPVNSSTKLFTLLTKQEKGKPTPSLYENAEGEKVKTKAETKGEGVEAFGYEESGQEVTHTLTAAEALEVEA